MYGGAPHAAWIEMRKNGICVLSRWPPVGGMALIGSGMAPYGGPRRCLALAALDRRRRATWCSPACSRYAGYWPLDSGAAARRPPAAAARERAGRRADGRRVPERGRQGGFKHIERTGEGDQLRPSAPPRVPTSSSCTRRAR